jgi:hypothetical protein
MLLSAKRALFYAAAGGIPRRSLIVAVVGIASEDRGK